MAKLPEPDTMTREAIVEELRKKKWDGSVSYGKPQLIDMLTKVRDGKISEIVRPKRGRPPLVKTEAAA